LKRALAKEKVVVRIIFLLVISFTIGLSSTTAIAQKRHHRHSATTNATSSTSTAKTSADLKAGREHVAAQIKVLTRFLYLFGGVSKTIESADVTAREGDAQSLVVKNQQSKTKIVSSIKELHDGLDKLETDFSANSTLRAYYVYVIGVSGIAQTSQSQAAAGHFDEAGSSLLKAVDRLTDALAAMH
jgi:hypothetical protein